MCQALGTGRAQRGWFFSSPFCANNIIFYPSLSYRSSSSMSLRVSIVNQFHFFAPRICWRVRRIQTRSSKTCSHYYNICLCWLNVSQFLSLQICRSPFLNYTKFLERGMLIFFRSDYRMNEQRTIELSSYCGKSMIRCSCKIASIEEAGLTMGNKNLFGPTDFLSNLSLGGSC